MQRLGPVLQFLGCQDGVWGVSLLLLNDQGDGPPDLSFDDKDLSASLSVNPTVPGTGLGAWRFDVGVRLRARAQIVGYQVGGQAHQFHVPARGDMPAMGYVSCNGYSSAAARKRQRAPNAMWERLKALHEGRPDSASDAQGPLHLLLHGGDQVYGDDMWASIPELRTWSDRDWYLRCHDPLSPSLRAALQTHFAQLYLERWRQPAIADLLASVPSVMMWDDHDILDGWGSHLGMLHDSPVLQGNFEVARDAFQLFQRQMTSPSPPPATLPGQGVHHSAYRMGPAGLLVLDMRSERRPVPEPGSPTALAGAREQVISAEGWKAVYTWLDAQDATSMTHLFVMSSIPVMHPGFAELEKLLGAMLGRQELEDDLRDHWTSPSNRAERLRLVHHLLGAGARGSRVTVLSGDVHVAALGAIESSREPSLPPNASVINQLTSSGIEHPAPAAVGLSFLEQACQTAEELDRGITGRMLPFPTLPQRIIGARNFLSLHPDTPGGAGRYWANWWVEGNPEPLTKAIHPVG